MGNVSGLPVQVSNPAALPDNSVRESIAEPFVKMEVITPSEYNGTLMDLCQTRRGEWHAFSSLSPLACISTALRDVRMSSYLVTNSGHDTCFSVCSMPQLRLAHSM
ncbi:MAG: hypothetical protein HC767_05615 [Akkermansiaceae bacterium]|nr:hypothetical protein [Akkermansiaceae bacterium]